MSSRFTRLIRSARRWRSGSSIEPLGVGKHLPEADLRQIRSLIDDIISAKGGQLAARRRARILGLTYTTLNADGRLRFFQELADRYNHNNEIVDSAIDRVRTAESPDSRRAAESELREALRPPSERLLRSFAGIDAGLPFLVHLREDLLPLRKTSTALTNLDANTRRILERWFDVALLKLERLDWHTSAQILEKLIQYEAVHAIESWDDLKSRLGPGRRCYGFLHPGMPDDPLIFVEVALTKGIAESLVPILEHNVAEDRGDQDGTKTVDEQDFDTAIFYSISNCHRGLAGISLGDFLIKSVVVELQKELPQLSTFSTLSPLPGFKRWVESQLEGGLVELSEEERLTINPGSPVDADAVLTKIVNGPCPPATDSNLEACRPVLLRLAAQYLLNERRDSSRSLDSVAHFHLTNGAKLQRINWMANPTEVGWERGLGFMVNYLYELKHIESNHDQYVQHVRVNAHDSVSRLLR